ncbi:hydantoinase B/oxoprolinase family protein [Rhizorhabdus histidinilytica]
MQHPAGDRAGGDRRGAAGAVGDRRDPLDGAGATVHTLNIQGATPDGSGLWSMLDVCFGSCGARHGEDGGDGLPLLFHGQAGYERNLEGYEWGHPVRYRCYRLAPDTGGPGRWRGGAGLVKEIEFQTDVVITARATDRFDRPRPASGAGWPAAARPGSSTGARRANMPCPARSPIIG